MVALITRRAGRRLPQGDVQPSTLARQLGIRSLFVPGGGQIVDLVSRSVLSTSGLTKVDTARGPAFSNGGSGSVVVPGALLSQTFSRIAIISLNATQYHTISDGRAYGTGGPQWRAENTGEMVLNKSNVVNVGTSSGAALVPGRAYVVGITYDAVGVVSFFVDGRAVGGATNQQSFIFGDIGGMLFSRGGVGETMNGAIGMHADFPPLPAAMMRALTRHPRLLLKDISRRLALAVPQSVPSANTALSGAATAVASAYGSLTTAIPLSGAVQAVASVGIAVDGAGPASLIVPSAGSGGLGSLSMTVTPAGSSSYDLTALGGVDWIVYNGLTPVRKAGGSSQIAIGHIGSFPDSLATDSHETATWSDGAGTVSGSTTDLIYSSSGVGIGYQMTFPADTQARVATIIAGSYNANVQITASLSDGSATQQIDNSIVGSSSAGSQAVIRIPYRANTAGARLTVQIVSTSSGSYSNTSFQAAALRLVATAAVLGGAAAAVATGSGALSTAIPLSGAAQATATAAGALATGMRLAGSASATAAAAGSLATSVKLAGAAAGVATGAGALTTATPLAGGAANVATAGGTLSTAIPLSGAAQAVAFATGTLAGSSAALAGSAAAEATATGAFATRITLSGGAQAVAQAYGALAGGGAALAGSAQARATATGALTTSVPLSGAGSARPTATGMLVTAIPLSGTAAASAGAGGALATRIALAGAAGAIATATGELLSKRRGVDVSQISPSRIVTFEGSGSRVVPFDGSGSRVVVFEGSGERVELN